jgi:hypothetical protein
MGVYREFVRRSVVCIAAVLILAAIPVAAQLPTGTILGNVKDSSGASIPGATLTVRNTETNLTKTAMTEQDGSYRFPELAVESPRAPQQRRAPWATQRQDPPFRKGGAPEKARRSLRASRARRVGA